MRVLLITLLAFLACGAYSKDIGGTVSLLDALVQKCDLIDDEYMEKKTGTEARESIMRSLRGVIGPINYESELEKSMRSGSVGGGKFGASIEPKIGRGIVPFPPGGKYVLSTTPAYERSIKIWKAGLKDKDPACTGEVAAALFTEALKSESGKLNETKMLDLFKKSADAGHAPSMFMCGVCFYYGIGCPQNKKKGLKALEAWKITSGATKAKRGGWVARRFETINK